MKYNMKLIRDYHVVTACAGCYFTFKNNYKVEKISHITEIIENLINEGKLKFSRVKGKIKVAYHKPCHLNNRTANRILNAIPGLQVIEIPNKCCGGGGGVRSAFEDLALNISTQRIKDVEKVNANLLVTACPFCVYNLRSIKVKSKPKVLDITEFLVTRVKH
jgi:Fe-S oxidoreductase